MLTWCARKQALQEQILEVSIQTKKKESCGFSSVCFEAFPLLNSKYPLSPSSEKTRQIL